MYSKKNENEINIITKSKSKKDKAFSCECGKKYATQTTLLNHKKKCEKVELHKKELEELSKSELEKAELEEPEFNEKELIMKLIKENQDLKKIILDQHNKLVEQEENLIEYVKTILTKIILASTKIKDEES